MFSHKILLFIQGVFKSSVFFLLYIFVGNFLVAARRIVLMDFFLS